MFRTVFCRVARRDVTLEFDLEAVVSHVQCSGLDPVTHRCRWKQHASGEGPLSQLIERSSGHRLTETGARCHFLL